VPKSLQCRLPTAACLSLEFPSYLQPQAQIPGFDSMERRQLN
jgi:hypothetical protein